MSFGSFVWDNVDKDSVYYRITLGIFEIISEMQLKRSLQITGHVILNLLKSCFFFRCFKFWLAFCEGICVILSAYLHGNRRRKKNPNRKMTMMISVILKRTSASDEIWHDFEVEFVDGVKTKSTGIFFTARFGLLDFKTASGFDHGIIYVHVFVWLDLFDRSSRPAVNLPLARFANHWNRMKEIWRRRRNPCRSSPSMGLIWFHWPRWTDVTDVGRGWMQSCWSIVSYRIQHGALDRFVLMCDA